MNIRTTKFGRTGASVAALLCLALTTGSAHADEPLCPECPDLVATITYDVPNAKFTLDIEEFPGFDYSGADTVELLLEEGTASELVTLGFGPEDVEHGVWAVYTMPTTITGNGTTAKLVFTNQSTMEEVYVDVTEQ